MSKTEDRKERCETCRFWEAEEWGRVTRDGMMDGSCHRYPARAATTDKQQSEVAAVYGKNAGSLYYASFPVLMADDWCGEWKPEEAKE